jgi:hypothetical protein
VINSVDSPVIYEMHEGIKNLGEHGFSFVNLHLTEEEKGALYTFSIHGDGDYNYYSDCGAPRKLDTGIRNQT